VIVVDRSLKLNNQNSSIAFGYSIRSPCNLSVIELP
jgi:hypothetical protein